MSARITGIMIIELNEFPLNPLFNKLTIIIEVTNVAELDFLFIPTYTEIKLIKAKDAEYITIVIEFFTKIFIVNGS